MVNLSLNFAPPIGTNLTVIKNTGPFFIAGAFSNLAQGQAITLSYGGVNYKFVANYYGGTGRDLVLQWANVRPVGFGNGYHGLLGDNSNANSSVPVAVLQSGILAGKTVLAVATGSQHSLALCSDGTLAAWGDNSYGQLGDNGAEPYSLVPVPVLQSGVLAGKTVIAISAGYEHNLALCSDGTVVAWGYNYDGEVGNNTNTHSYVPVAVNTSGALSGRIVIAISAGGDHSLALCSDGTLAGWGSNGGGQLGNNTTADSPVPVAVVQSGVLSSKTIIAISAGAGHCLALCADGTAAAWGYNSSGQLGNNTTTQSSVPVALFQSGLLASKTIIAVAAGASHSLALCSDGTVAAWGYNLDGELGNNMTAQSTVPAAVFQSGVLSGKTVTAIAAGLYHSLALCSDGTLAAWGYNYFGELGNGSTTDSHVPVVASTSTLATGERFVLTNSSPSAYHTLALVAVPAPMTSLQTWRQTYFNTTANNGNAADMFDFSGNGLPNLVKYAFGLDPTAAASRQLPQPVFDGNALTTTFNELPGVSGITYGAEWTESLNPANWQPVSDTGSGTTHIFSMSVAGHPSLFLRLKVSEQ